MDVLAVEAAARRATEASATEPAVPAGGADVSLSRPFDV